MLKSVNAAASYWFNIYYCSTKLNTMQIAIQWALPDTLGRIHKLNIWLDEQKVAKLKTYEADAEMTDWLIMIWAKNRIRQKYNTGNADPILLNCQILEQ
jgi:cobalamin biosynthesis Mg chelatase CobN